LLYKVILPENSAQHKVRFSRLCYHGAFRNR